MKLYSMAGACSLSDHIALRWTGEPFDLKVVTHDELKRPEFLKLNPQGAVPVLEDGGWALTQNAAILNYIAEKFPSAKLHGDNSAKTRAEINRWLGFLNADVHPAFHPLFGMSAALGPDAEKKAQEQAKTRLRKYFERLNEQLGGKEYLVGPRTLVDPYLFVVVQWAKKMGVDLSGLGNVTAFDARMQKDAGVQAALKAEGLG